LFVATVVCYCCLDGVRVCIVVEQKRLKKMPQIQYSKHFNNIFEHRGIEFFNPVCVEIWIIA
jgi:hypothetical protein